eukprot:TRINITY_DN22114_c0_g1_i1.p1 TRINITY_DN22114_c0_g1~~TRINITY_DN22114_c0_g1_i1.p1  ORF type:complete len:131 (+),score=11.93 TRINITY_DN22114_c0_g1_i1:29-394(+)
MYNSEVWVSSNAIERGMMLRTVLSVEPSMRKSLREAGAGMASSSRSSVQASPSSALVKSRSTPSMDTIGLGSQMSHPTHRGSFGPKFRPPAGAIAGHGHPSLNGSWGFGKFHAPSGSAWLK